MKDLICVRLDPAVVARARDAGERNRPLGGGRLERGLTRNHTRDDRVVACQPLTAGEARLAEPRVISEQIVCVLALRSADRETLFRFVCTWPRQSH